MCPQQQQLLFLFIFPKILLLLFSFIPLADAQNGDCADAPTTTARQVCEQLLKWDKRARAAPIKLYGLAAAPGKAGAEAVPQTEQDCMDLDCLCLKIGGKTTSGSKSCVMPNGKKLAKAVRKEYRMLSDEERRRFHAAVKALKKNKVYDEFAITHSDYAESSSAHGGPAFLPWHREFGKRFEFELRKVDPTVSTPYWDSTMDSMLPNPNESVIFSEIFMGTTDNSGKLVSGDFANWRTPNNTALTRNVGVLGNCFTENNITWLQNQFNVEALLGFSSSHKGCASAISKYKVIESMHGAAHFFVGGDMLETVTAANDPIFYVLHPFVDLIWELWRLSKQSRNVREHAYPKDEAFSLNKSGQPTCAAQQHYGFSLMRPFSFLNNIDGLSNKYTDNLYEYAPRPSCAMGPNCGSKYLFCDVSKQHCVSKIRLGGVCRGFERNDCCYDGVCIGGRCVKNAPAQQKHQPSPGCFNGHICCPLWSSMGECRKNNRWMSCNCRMSCGICINQNAYYNNRRTSTKMKIKRHASACFDSHFKCKEWAFQGECQRNPWMLANCKYSCNSCVPEWFLNKLCLGSRVGGRKKR